MPSQFTRDWFSHNIESWRRWLAELAGRPGIRALEIGSFEGRATTWLLENVLTDETSHIDCVDPFRKDYYRRFLSNIAAWRQRVTVHRGLSDKVLPTLEGAFDFVYIDGDHRPFAILSDSVLSWPRLKTGGILIFDDYLFVPHDLDRQASRVWSEKRARRQIARHPAQCPKTAIDGFLAAMTGQYEVLGQGYQLALRKLVDPGADLPSLTFATVPEDRASASGRGMRHGSARRSSRAKKPGEEPSKRRSAASRIRRRDR
ncbi:MAG TPA: class I SAM-dependent methyltransferase [Reyranella sp.]|nr:class I SAM-dependent methyltransferase [Reyranella sp.]